MSTGQPAHVLRFALHGTAPAHWYIAYVYPTLEPDFYSATGMYRIEPCPVGYSIAYVPMAAGGHVLPDTEHVGLEGGYSQAKAAAVRHLTARLVDARVDNQTVVVV